MVKLVSAKCPNCGAALKLSKEEEKTECEYCHNTIIVDDAIACYKLKVSGNVSVEGITTNAELIEAANELLDMKEFLKAKRKFQEFSEKCPDNYQGWLGLLICRTRNFTIRDNNIMFENDIHKYREHFFRVAPDDIKEQYFETIDRYFDPEKYRRLEEQERAEKQRQALEEQKRKAEEQKKFAAEEKEKRKAERLENPKYKAMAETADKGKSALLKIGVGILYFLGGVFVLDALVGDSPIGERLLTILIGLSMFKFIYTFIEEKFNIPNKTLLVVRIVLPIVLLIIVSSVYPASDNKTDTTESKDTISESTNENTNETVDEKVTIDNIQKHIESLGIKVEVDEPYYKLVGANAGIKIYSGDSRIEIYRFDKSSDAYKKAEKEQKLSSGGIASFDAVVKNGYAYLIDDNFPKRSEVISLLDKLS